MHTDPVSQTTGGLEASAVIVSSWVRCKLLRPGAAAEPQTYFRNSRRDMCTFLSFRLQNFIGYLTTWAKHAKYLVIVAYKCGCDNDATVPICRITGKS